MQFRISQARALADEQSGGLLPIAVLLENCQQQGIVQLRIGQAYALSKESLGISASSGVHLLNLKKQGVVQIKRTNDSVG